MAKKLLKIKLSRCLGCFELNFVKADIEKENKTYIYVNNCESTGVPYIFKNGKDNEVILRSQMEYLENYDSEDKCLDNLKEAGKNIVKDLETQKETITEKNSLWTTVLINIEFGYALQNLKSINKKEIEELNIITNSQASINLQNNIR